MICKAVWLNYSSVDVLLSEVIRHEREDCSVMQSLINSRPEATTALLMQLCTDMGDPSKADSDWVAKIGDFAHLYTNRCAARNTTRLSKDVSLSSSSRHATVCCLLSMVL